MGTQTRLDYTGVIMGYFVKCNDQFVGHRGKLSSDKEMAKYHPHPSEARKTIKAAQAKGMTGNWSIGAWVSEDIIERIENGS